MADSSSQILPPPCGIRARPLRRHIEVSPTQVFVEILDSALKELKVAEDDLAVKESPAISSSRFLSEEEWRLAADRVAWCEKKLEIALEMAVNPPPQFRSSGTVLMSACSVGNVELVKALLSRREPSLNKTAPHGMTALAWAVQGPMPGSDRSAEDYLEIVKALLVAGADVHIADNDGVTILTRAIRCGQREIEAVLRAAGAV